MLVTFVVGIYILIGIIIGMLTRYIFIRNYQIYQKRNKMLTELREKETNYVLKSIIRNEILHNEKKYEAVKNFVETFSKLEDINKVFLKMIILLGIVWLPLGIKLLFDFNRSTR